MGGWWWASVGDLTDVVVLVGGVVSNWLCDDLEGLAALTALIALIEG